MIYHSALEKYNTPIITEKEIQRFDICNSVGFTHNIIDGIPAQYQNCDCIYFEPFWESGFNKFKTENSLDFSLNDVVRKIAMFIEHTKIPVYTITSKITTKKLPAPCNIKRIILHGYESNLLIWNDDIDIERSKNNFDLIDQLSDKYNHVGDFMCGYGNTVLPFWKKGKSFTASDLLSKCITVIYKRIADGSGNNLN